MMSLAGDTTEQAGTGLDASHKPVDEKYVAADTEVDVLMSLPLKDPAGESETPVDEKYVAADTEVDFLMSHPLQDPAGESEDETTMQSVLPPSPPADVNHNSALPSDDQQKSDSEVDDVLQASGTVDSADDSAGYVSCSSSVLATADETMDDLQPTADISSGGAFFHRSKHLMSAATKYRLRCQCGAKNCRQYLY